MAATGGRSESIAVALADQAFGSLANQLQFSKNDLENIFNTVASACKTTGERWLYMQTCKASGANPFKKDIFAVATRKQENGQWVNGVDFRFSYHFINGTVRAAGYLIVSAQHWSNDVWGGWDYVGQKPCQHVQGSPTKRGMLLGAWAQAIPTKGGPAVGAYLTLEELVPGPLFKDKVKDTAYDSALNGAFGPFWSRMPGRQAEKCIVAHVGRRVCPDLAAAYLAEEFGDVIDVEAIQVPRKELAAPVDAPAALANPETVDVAAAPLEPSGAVPEQAAAEPTTDDLILAAVGKLAALDRDKCKLALKDAKDGAGQPLRGATLLAYLEDAVAMLTPAVTP